MPAVGLFAYGIGAAIAGAFGLIPTFAVGLAIGSSVLALTVASVRKVRDLKDGAPHDSGLGVMVRSTDMPRTIVFGEARVGGLITYCNTTGEDKRELYYEIVHTGHEVDSFIGWYIDDKYVPIADVDTGGDGSVDSDSTGHDLDPYLGTPVLYLRRHLGTAAQAVDSQLDTAFSDITSTHKHVGCARSNVRCDLIKGGEHRWNGRAPGQITAVIRGAKCYDPRADSTFPGGSGAHRLATESTWTWTDNPALIWARYRTMPYPLGPGWASSRINYQSVFDAANACDVSVAIPTAATEKRFRCDLVVDTSMDPKEVIAAILATMFGNERLFNGYWSVYAGVWPTPDFALTEADLLGELQYRKQPESEDRFNQVKGAYLDRDRLWKNVPFISVTNGTLRTNRDNGRTLQKDMTLLGVSREYQAQRLAMRALNQADDTGVLVFPTGYNGLRHRVGDVGTVTYPELGWTTKSFRIVQVRFVEFVGVELTMKEDDSGNYNDPIEGAYSTRTAAGTISFGRVFAWYLTNSPAFAWNPVLVNVTQSGNDFTKTGGAASTWDTSVYSTEGYPRAHFSFSVVSTSHTLAVGFDGAPSASHTQNTIDSAWLLDPSTSKAYVIRNGSSDFDAGAYAVGDRFSAVDNGRDVIFYKNGAPQFTFASPDTLRYLDSSIYTSGGVIGDLVFGPVERVDTGQADLELATEVAAVSDATGVSESANNTIDIDYAAQITLTAEEDTDLFEITITGVSVTSTTGSPGTPQAGVRIRVDINGGGIQFPTTDTRIDHAMNVTVAWALTGTLSGLSAGDDIDFYLASHASEAGGTGTVNHAASSISHTVTRIKR